VSYTFKGTGIQLIGEKNINQGFADVSIDGVHLTTIDTYSPTLKENQVLFSKIGMTEGQHKVTISCKGQKHPLSSGYFIEISGFKVTGN
jgi:exosome complex RNA-binding protein Rrp4